MPNLNRVTLMGHLTRDPELRFVAGGSPVCNLSLAINRRYRNARDELKEDVCYVDCEAWGRTGETISEYLSKGRPVFIEGRLKLDQWQGSEGQNRSKLKVVIEQFQFVDSRHTDQTAADEEREPHGVEAAADSTDEGDIPH